jgi:hypothetical protein
MDQWNGQQRAFAIKNILHFVGFLQFLLDVPKVPVFLFHPVSVVGVQRTWSGIPAFLRLFVVALDSVLRQ